VGFEAALFFAITFFALRSMADFQSDQLQLALHTDPLEVERVGAVRERAKSVAVDEHLNRHFFIFFSHLFFF
jgi:hypothetical protein